MEGAWLWTQWFKREWNGRKTTLQSTYLSTLFTNVKRLLLYVTYTVHCTPAQNSLFPLPENLYDTTGVFAMVTIPLYRLNLLFKLNNMFSLWLPLWIVIPHLQYNLIDQATIQYRQGIFIFIPLLVYSNPPFIYEIKVYAVIFVVNNHSGK